MNLSFISQICGDIFEDVFNGAKAAILYVLKPLLYGIQIGLFYIINALQTVVKRLVGLEPHYWRTYPGGEVTEDGSDPALGFLQDHVVQETFFSVMIAAVFLLIITTFIAIIKTEFDEKDNSKTPIIERAIKGLAYFFIVPVTCYLGIFVANTVLKMLDSATSRGAQYFSNQIFVAAATKANKIRQRNAGVAAVAAGMLPKVKETMDLAKEGDEKFGDYYKQYLADQLYNHSYEIEYRLSSARWKYKYTISKDYIYEPQTENKQAYLWFNTGYLEKPTADMLNDYFTDVNMFTLTDENEVEGKKDLEKWLSSVHDVKLEFNSSAKIKYSHISSPYSYVQNSTSYTPYSLKNLGTNSVENDADEITAILDGCYVAFTQNETYNYNQDPAGWKEKLKNSISYSATYNTGESTIVESEARTTAPAHSVENVPNLTVEDTVEDAAEDVAKNSYLIAKYSNFSCEVEYKGKEVKVDVWNSLCSLGAQVWNIFMAQASGNLVEAAAHTGGSSEGGGGYLAYDWGDAVYSADVWSVDNVDDADLETLAMFIDDCFRIGVFSPLDYGAVDFFYDLTDYNYLIGWLGSGMIVTLLLQLMIGVIQRIFELAVLFVASPPIIALMPLDNGDRYKEWRKMFIQRVFSAYGPILGMNLAFMVLEMLNSPTRDFLLFNPEDTLSNIYNGIMGMIIMFTALVCIKSIVKMVTELIGQGDALKAGEETGKAVKELGLKTAGLASSAVMMPATVARGAMGVARQHGLAQGRFNDHTYFDKDGNALSEDEYNAKVASGEIDPDEWETGRNRWASADAATKAKMREEAAKHGADTRSRRMLDYGYSFAGAHVNLANAARTTLYNDEKLEKDIGLINPDTWLGGKLNAPIAAKKARKEAAKEQRNQAARNQVGYTVNNWPDGFGGGGGGAGGAVPTGGAGGGGTNFGGPGGGGGGYTNAAGKTAKDLNTEYRTSYLRNDFNNKLLNDSQRTDAGKKLLTTKLEAQELTLRNNQNGQLTAAQEKQFNAAKLNIQNMDTTKIAEAMKQIDENRRNALAATSPTPATGFQSTGANITAKVEAKVKLDENSMSGKVVEQLKNIMRAASNEKAVIDELKDRYKQSKAKQDAGDDTKK